MSGRGFLQTDGVGSISISSHHLPKKFIRHLKLILIIRRDRGEKQLRKRSLSKLLSDLPRGYFSSQCCILHFEFKTIFANPASDFQPLIILLRLEPSGNRQFYNTVLVLSASELFCQLPAIPVAAQLLLQLYK